MRKSIQTLGLVLAAVAAGGIAAAEAVKLLGVDGAPAVVVKTVPEAGAKDVDWEKVTEVKVTFSKKMTDGSWSWSTQTAIGEPLPGVGKPHYEADGKTCVMKVKLEKGKAYACWLNSPNFGNFRDASGQSAVPYLLVFETKGE